MGFQTVLADESLDRQMDYPMGFAYSALSHDHDDWLYFAIASSSWLLM
jgi:hypothetical protein